MKSFREVGDLMLQGLAARGFREDRGWYLGRPAAKNGVVPRADVVWGCGVGAVLVGFAQNARAAEVILAETSMMTSPIVAVAERVGFEIRLSRAICSNHRKGRTIAEIAEDLRNGVPLMDSDGELVIEEDLEAKSEGELVHA